MSEATLRKLWVGLRTIIAVNSGVLTVCTMILCAAMPRGVYAQDIGQVLTVSRKLAEQAPLDVTRLALQVALASILVNLALFAAVFRLLFGFARKPCLMATGDARAVMREALREAKKEG